MSNDRPPARQTLFRIVLTLVMAVVITLGLLLALELTRGRPGIEFTAPKLRPGEVLYPGDDRYVLDAVVGHRPRSAATTKFDMQAVNGTLAHTCVRRTDSLGLIRDEELPRELTSPRILLVGDSHVEGVVSTPLNAASLLESWLRRARSMPGALVLNASSAYYSLYQYVLRIRSLIPKLRPDVLVVVVFLGNDLLELEDVSRPHLDDLGNERPAVDPPPPETTSKRRAWLALDDDAYFWQGQNQAAYFYRSPGRRLPALVKATRCLELLKAEAARCRAHLEIVLLPPYEIVFPDAVAALAGRSGEVVGSGVQAALYDDFRRRVEVAGISSIDLLPVFRTHGSRSLYAGDLHVYLAGHEVIAKHLGSELEAVLRARRAK